MNDFVSMDWKRNRGWPWPENSFGLTPMYGEDGWCKNCAVPNREQTGSLVLQRQSMRPVGAWVPNWIYDTICVSAVLVEEIDSRFDVDLRAVEWAASSPGEAMQLVIPTVGESWFDPEQLRERVIEDHARDGATCPVCGVWRWFPIVFDTLPPLDIKPGLGDRDIAASPEWFGDGRKAFRQILVRRELGELLASSSPRDFSVQEVEWQATNDNVRDETSDRVD